MDKKLINKSMIMSIVFSVVMSGMMIAYLATADIEAIAAEEQNIEDVTVNEETDDIEDKSLVISLPEDTNQDSIDIHCIVEQKRILISMNGVPKEFLYDNPLTGDSSHVEKLLYKSNDVGSEIEIILDGYYGCDYEFDSQSRQLRMRFLDIHEMYDYVIVIDPGHGGDDAGTRAYDVAEADVTYKLAMYLRDELVKRGIGTFVTRGDGQYADVLARHELAKSLDADAYVSIHVNGNAASRTNYGMTLYYNKVDSALDSSNDLEDSFVRAFGLLDNQVKQMNIEAIDGLECPAVVYMPGYLTNKSDAMMLSDDEQLYEISVKMCAAVEDYFLNE